MRRCPATQQGAARAAQRSNNQGPWCIRVRGPRSSPILRLAHSSQCGNALACVLGGLVTPGRAHAIRLGRGDSGVRTAGTGWKQCPAPTLAATMARSRNSQPQRPGITQREQTECQIARRSACTTSVRPRYCHVRFVRPSRARHACLSTAMPRLAVHSTAGRVVW